MARLHHVRLELAREASAPDGDHGRGYDLVVPLDDASRLADLGPFIDDVRAGHVRRFRGGETDALGRLIHGPGGAWLLAFEGEAQPELGFRLGEERMEPGEYLSIREADGVYHPYRVVVARELA